MRAGRVAAAKWRARRGERRGKGGGGGGGDGGRVCEVVACAVGNVMWLLGERGGRQCGQSGRGRRAMAEVWERSGIAGGGREGWVRALRGSV